MADNALHELSAAYALDALDATDARAYERHLAHCERCQGELALLTAGAVALAFAAPEAEPPPELRTRILTAVHDERPNVVQLRPRLRPSLRWSPVRAFAVAASVAAVGLGVWAAVLHHQLDRSHGALQTVAVQGASGSVVVGPSGQGTLVLAGLAAPPAGKTYEAWVIDDGRAEPAGVFAGGKTVVVHLLRHVPHGAIVGVTVERAGGAQQPSSTPFITSARV